MRRYLLFTIVLGSVVFEASIPATAHHSFAAAFDGEQPITVSGVITQVRLENPHAWFFLEVTDGDGGVVEWSFEASTPTSLIRSGVRPDFVKAGEEVTIRGWHAWDPKQNVGAAREIELDDGRAFAVGPPIGRGGR